jgi:hypothetical protein
MGWLRLTGRTITPHAVSAPRDRLGEPDID